VGSSRCGPAANDARRVSMVRRDKCESPVVRWYRAAQLYCRLEAHAGRVKPFEHHRQRAIAQRLVEIVGAWKRSLMTRVRANTCSKSARAKASQRRKCRVASGHGRHCLSPRAPPARTAVRRRQRATICPLVRLDDEWRQQPDHGVRVTLMSRPDGARARQAPRKADRVRPDISPGHDATMPARPPAPREVRWKYLSWWRH